jgi:excisionase family DNA binding protein
MRALDPISTLVRGPSAGQHNGSDSVLSLDRILDALAARLAVRLRDDFARMPEQTIRPRLLTVEQAAAYIGRTKNAVQYMTAARKIPVVRDGRRVFLDLRELDRWIEQNTERAER